ncbi:right-handed parallel beta-helix repeat-containing protein [Rhodobium gokarnense]|uniref:Right handed beta helix domain-containing protein n=1 Tax=Rhodobium gokarnense TaxID=364296 RepID=A0ABT3HDD9_9HYPH|nr:right-handed parallel beta-helix repeat-containing protein [Rhodobium gokarnense]MCW2308418.1 hypothetical protein [Rhodobium gokarnense]
MQRKIRVLEPGETLTLRPGEYRRPITAVGLRGSASNRITIRGQSKGWYPEETGDQQEPDPSAEAVLTTGMSAELFRRDANMLARKKQAAGGSPGLYYIADEAMLFLRDCQHVTVENLYFNRCWPTAVYLDNCQDITVRSCQFRWGTYAVGAAGFHTRHLTVEGCRWQQNPDNKGRHWKDFLWFRIHGDLDEENPPDGDGRVSIEEGWRLFDGDFFVGWRIAGFVTLRGNLIEDAFNAIHMFNFTENPRTDLNLNVVVENNRFVRIRDNAMEPEGAAWNWVVRHNVFVDVYRWFGFEVERSGWFYIYGNLAWYTQVPGPDPGADGKPRDDHTGGSVFKFNTKHVADGPTYVFHNSFHLREPIAKKKRFAKLAFFNNAIAFCKAKEGGCTGRPTLFAQGARALAMPHDPAADLAQMYVAEKKRFTKDWEALEIVFDGNFIHGPDRLSHLRAVGYLFGDASSDLDPGFAGPLDATNTSASSFRLDHGAEAAGKSIPFVLKTKNDFQTFKDAGGGNVGAIRDDGSLFQLADEFEWITVKMPPQKTS